LPIALLKDSKKLWGMLMLSRLSGVLYMGTFDGLHLLEIIEVACMQETRVAKRMRELVENIMKRVVKTVGEVNQNERTIARGNCYL
jgi:hypothetical protein